MEGFKETHNERKLFFKYTTVLLLCKSTQHSGCAKSQNTSPTELGQWKCLEWGLWQSLCLPSHNEPVWVSGQDTQSTWMDEGAWSHTLTGQTSTVEK